MGKSSVAEHRSNKFAQTGLIGSELLNVTQQGAFWTSEPWLKEPCVAALLTNPAVGGHCWKGHEEMGRPLAWEGASMPQIICAGKLCVVSWIWQVLSPASLGNLLHCNFARATSAGDGWTELEQPLSKTLASAHLVEIGRANEAG